MSELKTRWTLENQSNFLIRLSGLLDNGYTLLQAIEFLKYQTPHRLSIDIERCLVDFKNGTPLHEVFSSIGFHRDVLGYLYFAEQHGNLAFALKEGGKILDRKLRTIQKIRKAIQYPSLLFIFLFIILSVLSTVLMPQFQMLYTAMGAEMSLPLRIVTDIVRWLPYSCFFFICFFSLSILFYLVSIKKLPPLKQMDFWLICPLIKKMLPLINSYFFSVHLGNLLAGGLSIHETLTVFERQNHHLFLKAEAGFLKRQLIAGNSLEQIVDKRKYYDSQLANIIRHGQSNGNLPQELINHGQFVINRVEQFLFKWLNIIQPVMFSLIGLIILTTYLSIMLPMFKMMSEI